MEVYTIYRHINRLNGKSYIGQTCQALNKRWKNGKGYTAKRQQVFYKAIQKYGWENFEHEILEDGITSLAEANVREKFWIAHYHTWVYDPECNGYNVTQGGDGSPGRKMSEKTKAKIRKAVYCVELDKTFDSLTEASEATGCLVSKISLCCRGRANTACGYHWRYSDKLLADAAKCIAENREIKKQEYYKTVGTAVYCIADDRKFVFSSRNKAAKWWFDTYRPFGPTFCRSTYLKKINQSIAGEIITTGANQYDINEITNIKWFLEVIDKHE